MEYRREGGNAVLFDNEGFEWATDEANDFVKRADGILEALNGSGIEPDDDILRGVYEKGAEFVLDKVEADTRGKLEQSDLPEVLKSACGKLARQSVSDTLTRAVGEARTAAKEQAVFLPQGTRPVPGDLSIIDGHVALSAAFWKRLKANFTLKIPKEVVQMTTDIMQIANKLRTISDLGFDLCTDRGGSGAESGLSGFVQASALPEDRSELTEKGAIVALMRSRSRKPDEKRQLLGRAAPDDE